MSSSRSSYRVKLALFFQFAVFTLKLSASVGEGGRVLADDIRKLPLTFLWFRSFRRRQHNVKIILGNGDDPRLPLQTADAVLIANTYHEFTNAQAILARLVMSLVSGGRLVIVDRAPGQAANGSAETAAAHHEVLSEQVASELRHAGFEIVNRQDDFIQHDPLNENWWMITARKP